MTRLHVRPTHSLLASCEGRQRAVVEGLLIGYFDQGRDIGDPEVLVEIAAKAGLHREAVRELLESGTGDRAVRELEDLSYSAGVKGVPHFDIEGTVLTGAQSPTVLRQAIVDAHSRQADDAPPQRAIDA